MATLGLSLGRSGTLVWRYIDRIDGAILRGGSESNCRKIRLCVVPFGTRDELNDFGAHDNSSDTAMTTRPRAISGKRSSASLRGKKKCAA
jgi:hypothetical protein